MRVTLRSLLVASLLLPICLPLRSQLRLHGRYILTSTEVAHAISTAFSKDYPHAGQPTVLLLSDVVATEADPRLDVDRATVTPRLDSIQTEQQVAVQMRCHAAAVCLPFYVLVSWSSPSASTMVGVLNTPNRLPRTSASKITVHQGAHVLLSLEGPGTRLELPVVALQSAQEGALVLAISLDRRHTYKARVISENRLKGDI